MGKRQGFDSDTIITAALAKAGKVIVTPAECRAAKKQVIIVTHGHGDESSSTHVIEKEDFDRWVDEGPDGTGVGERVAAKPPR